MDQKTNYDVVSASFYLVGHDSTYAVVDISSRVESFGPGKAQGKHASGSLLLSTWAFISERPSKLADKLTPFPERRTGQNDCHCEHI